MAHHHSGNELNFSRADQHMVVMLIDLFQEMGGAKKLYKEQTVGPRPEVRIKYQRWKVKNRVPNKLRCRTVEVELSDPADDDAGAARILPLFYPE